jgi:hypothetical protein
MIVLSAISELLPPVSSSVFSPLGAHADNESRKMFKLFSIISRQDPFLSAKARVVLN